MIQGAVHLAKRAVQENYPTVVKASSHASNYFTQEEVLDEWVRENGQNYGKMFVITAGVVFFIIAIGVINYLSLLVMTLTVVEAKMTPIVTAKVTSDEKKNLLEGDVEEAIQYGRPVRATDSLRTTIKFVRTTPGSRGILHGVGATAAYKIFSTIFTIAGCTIAMEISRSQLVAAFVGTAVGALLSSKFAMSAVHARIAVPAEGTRQLSSFKRVGGMSFAMVSKTITPLVFLAVSRLFVSQGIEMTTPTEDSTPRLVHPHFAVAAAFVALISYPARLILMRQQASALPYSDDTMVNVDTTFGCKAVIPQNGEQQKTLTFCQAARTFSMDDVKHIASMQVKILLTQWAAFSGLIISYAVIGATAFYFGLL
jgi:hypothetical protein